MDVIATVLKKEIELSIDGVFFKKFSKKIFGKYFEKPLEFSDKDQLDHWLFEIESKEVGKYAFHLLSYKNYPSHLLMQKLIEIGISESVAKNQIKKLIELRYIDDEAFLEYLIQKEIARCYGPHYIRLKLMNKQFAYQAIEELLQKLMAIDVQEKYIDKLIEKLKNTRTKSQIYQYILRKGFDAQLIQKMINWQES